MKRPLLKKLCVAFLGFSGISLAANGQHWLASVSGTTAEFSGEYRGNHLAVDATGNSYTTGTYRALTTAPVTTSAYSSGQTGATGTAAFSVDVVKAASGTKENSFITKTNASGSVEWMIGLGGTSSSSTHTTVTNTIATDNGNVYIGGRFGGTINYFSSMTNPPASIISSASTDGLLLKLSDAGAYLWHKTFGGTGVQQVNGVTTDADGNILVVGAFDNELTIDGAATTIVSSLGVADVFIAKFKADGTLLFLTSIGGTGSDTVWGLTSDTDNSIYISGSFVGDMTVGTTTIAVTGTNTYVAKLSASLVPVWAKAIKSSGNSMGASVAVDNETTLSNRGLYLTGHLVNDGVAKVDFAGTEVDFNGGTTSHPYVAKLNAETGVGNWAQIYTAGGTSYGYVVSVNPNNDLFAAGYAVTTLVLGSETKTLAGNDAYILKLDRTNGSLMESKIISTTGTDRVMGLVATNTTVYANGIAGGTTNASTANFGGTGADFYYRGGSWDIFIMKWGSTTLPVSLAEFKGSKSYLGNLLTWSTLSETDNQYFDLERSVDGLNFSSITRLQGAGNSTTKVNYSYLDANPLAGVNYYRLKQVDANGTFTYSAKTIAINSQLETSQIKVYPNPGNGIMNVSVSSDFEKASITVVNQIGRVVNSLVSGSNGNYLVDISKEPSGIYFIQVIAEGKSKTIKYIKQ